MKHRCHMALRHKYQTQKESSVACHLFLLYPSLTLVRGHLFLYLREKKPQPASPSCAGSMWRSQGLCKRMQRHDSRGVCPRVMARLLLIRALLNVTVSTWMRLLSQRGRAEEPQSEWGIRGEVIQYVNELKELHLCCFPISTDSWNIIPENKKTPKKHQEF